MEHTFKLFEFNIYNDKNTEQSSSDGSDSETFKHKKDKSTFVIQMFGINDKRETYSITVYDFKPFVYVKVGSKWNKSNCDEFIDHLEKLTGITGIIRNFNINFHYNK